MDKGFSGMDLQLKSVEKGSDVFNFIVYIGSLILSNDCISSNTYFELLDNLKHIKKQSVEDIQKEKYIDKIMAKDFANIINQNTFNIHSDNLQYISQIKGFYEKIEAKSIENIIIGFYQTTNTQKSKAHKAYCYNLSKSAKNIFIDDERLKLEMLENPYRYKFLIDLEVAFLLKHKMPLKLKLKINYITK